MHTISIPCKITRGQDIIHKKRLGLSLLVRIAYSHLSKSIPEKTVNQTLRTYRLMYNLESKILENALIEAKGLHQADKAFQKTHQKKQAKILQENKKIQKQRTEIKNEIQESKDKEQSDSVVRNIKKLKKRLSTLKVKKELPDYHLGHMVFGGKNNLRAHQKRVERLNQDIQNIKSDSTLTSEQKNTKIIELTSLIKKSKREWKESRLRPLAICGNTRKGGNQFFKIADAL